MNGWKNLSCNFQKTEVVIMDISKAKEIVGALAEGTDPITGEILPSEHV